MMTQDKKINFGGGKWPSKHDGDRRFLIECGCSLTGWVVAMWVSEGEVKTFKIVLEQALVVDI